jgi:ankyrin repeat protein
MNKYILLILILILTNCSSLIEDQNNYLGNDVRLFKNTPVWEVAQAIHRMDTIEVKQLLNGDLRKYINFRENKFGFSLLYWSVYNSYYPAVKVLAELGADPNLKSYDSTSAFIQSANHHENTDYLKILLKYGGNVNAVADIDAPEHLRTPLIAAAKSLDNVKLLIKAGANPNYVYHYGGVIQSALVYAFFSDNIDIIKYLIIDVGVNCKHATGVTINGDSLYVTDNLRTLPYPLNSEEYKKKMEVVDYLSKQGLDYNKSPIPEHYYKLYSNDYLSKY